MDTIVISLHSTPNSKGEYHQHRFTTADKKKTFPTSALSTTKVQNTRFMCSSSVRRYFAPSNHKLFKSGNSINDHCEKSRQTEYATSPQLKMPPHLDLDLTSTVTNKKILLQTSQVNPLSTPSVDTPEMSKRPSGLPNLPSPSQFLLSRDLTTKRRKKKASLAQAIS